MQNESSKDIALIHEEIARRKPYLLSVFKSPLNMDYVYSRSKDGAELITNTGKATASTYNPVKEASRLIAQAGQLKGTEILLVEGAGNHHIFEQLPEILASNQICIVVEARNDLISFLAHTSPSFLKCLLKPGFHVFAGKKFDHSLYTYLDSIPSDRFSGLRIIKHTNSVSHAQSYYTEIEKSLQSMMQSRLSDLLTRFEFEEKWIRNILINATGLSADFGPTKFTWWIDRFTNQHIPGLLVAAGPSLPDSFELIRSIRSKVFLLACDTALKPLLRAGITPDAVHILDSQKVSMLHLLPENLENVIVFADLVIHPEVIRKVKPVQWVFSSTAKYGSSSAGNPTIEKTPGTDFVEQYTGEIGYLQSGGSVATSAFDLLRNLGCNSIYLVGQDLAWSYRKLHSNGTHHYEKWQAIIHRLYSLQQINEDILARRKTFSVPGLDGNDVRGDYVLDLYRTWFSDSARSVNIPVYNLTERGALIENATSLKGQEAIDHFNDLPEIEPYKILKNRIVQPNKTVGAAYLKEIFASLEKAITRKRSALFFEDYPGLSHLKRRADIYVKRRDFDEKRLQEEHEKRAMESLVKLQNGLRKFI